MHTSLSGWFVKVYKNSGLVSGYPLCFLLLFPERLNKRMCRLFIKYYFSLSDGQMEIMSDLNVFDWHFGGNNVVGLVE